MLATFKVYLERHDVKMPALDWDGHSKISDNTRLKFKINLLDFNLVLSDILLYLDRHMNGR